MHDKVYKTHTSTHKTGRNAFLLARRRQAVAAGQRNSLGNELHGHATALDLRLLNLPLAFPQSFVLLSSVRALVPGHGNLLEKVRWPTTPEQRRVTSERSSAVQGL